MKKTLILGSLLTLNYLTAATLNTDKAVYNTTDTITINFKEMDNHNKDWIAIYPSGSSTTWGNVVKWGWTENKSEGTLSFKNLPAGHYEARAFYNNTYNSEARKAFVVKDTANGTKASLAYMYDEERLAKEVYLAIYAKQPVQQLTKIATKAEVRHIDAVKDLAVRYGVPTPYQRAGQYQTSHIQSLYNELYAKGIRSKRDALEVGCMVEVIDVEDLQKYIREAEQANAQDVVQPYNFLLKGSYNHYWAFDRGLKQLGVSNGCCSVGDRYCHPEYPQNQKGGRGNGQGRGQGRGGGGWR